MKWEIYFTEIIQRIGGSCFGHVKTVNNEGKESDNEKN